MARKATSRKPAGASKPAFRPNYDRPRSSRPAEPSEAVSAAQQGMLQLTFARHAHQYGFLGVAAFYARGPLAMLVNEDVTLAMQLGPVALRDQYQLQALECWLNAGAAILALVGAYLVSYTRARMEGLGVECKVGWFERPERLALFLGAALFGAASPVMPWALVVLALMSFLTALQRMRYARSRLVDPATSGV